MEAKSETNEGTTTTGTKYAFVASGSPALSENWYYKAINEVPKEGGKEGETEPMLPVSGYVLAENLESIKPIDLNAKVYNTFIGKWEDWNPARAFDSALVKYYSGRYTLETIDELTGTDTPATESGYTNWNELFVMTHYGDWPSPEVFFINTAS
ncbi:MAG: hypothetical protein IJH86_00655 [Clostridia bacterium]|nr:hypothetical protein [Clostridia bacterium]